MLQIDKKAYSSDSGTREFATKEGRSAINQVLASMQQQTVISLQNTYGTILDALKKIEQTKLPEIYGGGKKAWIEEQMKPFDEQTTLTESGRNAVKAELEALYDIENFFMTSAKDFKVLTNELTSKGGFVSGRRVERNNSQEIMQNNVARLKELVSQLKTEVSNSNDHLRNIADTL